jgi:hypothetical protein
MAGVVAESDATVPSAVKEGDEVLIGGEGHGGSRPKHMGEHMPTCTQALSGTGASAQRDLDHDTCAGSHLSRVCVFWLMSLCPPCT